MRAPTRLYALLCEAPVVTDALSRLPVELGALVLEPLHAVVLWRLALAPSTPRRRARFARGRVPFAPVLEKLERDQERWRGRVWRGAWV